MELSGSKTKKSKVTDDASPNSSGHSDLSNTVEFYSCGAKELYDDADTSSELNNVSARLKLKMKNQIPRKLQ